MRALISFVLIAVTVVLQLTVVDRIAFPGGAGPDLVLLAVAALALAGGPLAGVLIGFWGGLALDVAPPGSHFTGQDALVFCLVGYACGLLADDSAEGAEGHTALFEILMTAAGAVCGEALVALLGVMLSDPRVTWPAITRVLPAAVAYDVLLCPFVLYAAAAALRLAGARAAARPAGWTASQVRAAAPAGASQGAIRQLADGNGPRLRLSERDKGPGTAGGLRGPGAGRPATRREPQLKLGRTIPRSPAGYRTTPGAAFASGQRAGLGAAKVKFGSSSMGRSLLGGSVFSRPSSSPSLVRSGALRPGAFRSGGLRPGTFRSGGLRPGAFRSGSLWSGRPAPLGRASPLRHRGSLVRPAGGALVGLAGPAPRFSRGSLLARLGGTRASWLSAPRRGAARFRAARFSAPRFRAPRFRAARLGAWRRSPGPKSPGRGWLRGASSRGRFLSRGSLTAGALGRGSLKRYSPGRGAFSRGASPRRLRGLGRLRLRGSRTNRRWRTGGYR